MSIDQEKMIVEALPSLYPLKDYEEEAIDTIIKAIPHWIPVTERLPVEEGRYLVCGKKGGIYHANYRGGWWMQVGCGGKLVPSVMAWMPLPEPYKGVTDDRF